MVIAPAIATLRPAIAAKDLVDSRIGLPPLETYVFSVDPLVRWRVQGDSTQKRIVVGLFNNREQFAGGGARVSAPPAP